MQDSSTIRAVTRRLLEMRGHTVVEATNGLEGLEQLEKRVEERAIELKEAHLDMIYSMATAAEAKDDDTCSHVRRIQYYSKALVKQLGMPEAQAEEIGYSSINHDVGKISIPDEILKKSGNLTEEEFELIKIHPVQGENILSDKNFFATSRLIARHHHEKWNGKGYPDNLSKDTIPLPARIVAMADVFDALTSKRPYKDAWPMEKAIEELKISSGSHFNPGILRAWLALWESGEIRSIFDKWQ